MTTFIDKEILFSKFDQATILAIAMSWMLYPWAISWIFPNLTRLIVFVTFILVVLWTYLGNIEGRKVQWYPLVNAIFLLYGIYACILIIGSLTFHQHPDLRHVPRYILKILVFIYLLKYLSTKQIDKLFDLFSNTAVFLTFISIIGVVGLYFNIFHVATVMTTQGIDNFQAMGILLSGFDGNARFFSTNPTIFRVQSFAIEPGAYALASVVALYWLLFMKSSTIRVFILALGIALSGAVGTLLGVVIILILVSFNKRVADKAKLKLILIITIFLGVGYGIKTLNMHQHAVLDSRIVADSKITKAPRDATKQDSMQQRINENKKIFEYLSDHHEGAGIGGAKKHLKNSISVGYINAMADAGVIGGIFYISAFALLAWLAFMAVIGKFGENCEVKSRRMHAIGCAVIGCLFTSWQREQPDSSYWHFWIFASFLISSELFIKKISFQSNETHLVDTNNRSQVIT